MCFCLRKRGNAAHFQLINTAGRACWWKAHYAAGWLVGWIRGGERWEEERQDCYHDSVKGRERLPLVLQLTVRSLVLTEQQAGLSALHGPDALFLSVGTEGKGGAMFVYITEFSLKGRC